MDLHVHVRTATVCAYTIAITLLTVTVWIYTYIHVRVDIHYSSFSCLFRHRCVRARVGTSAITDVYSCYLKTA